LKLINLTRNKIDTMVASVFVNKKGKEYYNIKHGSYGDALWLWRANLDYSIFKPNDSSITLDGDDYSIYPIRNNGEIVKDGKGNVIYMVTKDNNHFHKKHILIFWEIPNDNYIDVVVKIKGDCDLLGTGYNGKERGEKSYISPAPIIEVHGDSVLEWCAKDNNGNYFKQIVTVSPNENTKFDISKISSVTESVYLDFKKSEECLKI